VEKEEISARLDRDSRTKTPAPRVKLNRDQRSLPSESQPIEKEGQASTKSPAKEESITIGGESAEGVPLGARDKVLADQSLDEETDAGTQLTKGEVNSIMSMIQNEKYMDAVQALRALKQRALGNPIFHYLCGLTYDGLGNHAQALENLKKAIDRGVYTPLAHAACGRAQLHLGDFEAAIKSLNVALELADSDVPDFLADLARAYRKSNNAKDEAKAWNRLREVDPTHPALRELSNYER
jgi:tetratricopeptide (TPR) repeat protein